MAFTRVVGPGIHTQANVHSHNIQSTGIITATKFDGPFDSLTVSGNLSIGGTLTYEDVTNIDSVGLITARKWYNFIWCSNSNNLEDHKLVFNLVVFKLVLVSHNLIL